MRPRIAVAVNVARVWPSAAPGAVLSGTLSRWIITQCNDWLGYTTFTVGVRGTELRLTMLVPSAALRPADHQPSDGRLVFPVAEAMRPPQLVLVHPGRLWPPTRFRWAVETPLIIKSQGVQLNQLEVGMLRGWVYASTGRLGYVDWMVPLQGNGIPLSALLPEAAFRPAGPDQVADLDGLRTAALWR